MSLYLPFIRHLRHSILRDRYRVAPMVSVTPTEMFSVAEHAVKTPIDVQLCFESTFRFAQWVRKDDLEKSENHAGAALANVRQRAVRAIAHGTFGPIENELRSILALLWQEGQGESEVARRIEAMLPVLRGEQDGAT